MRFIFRIYGMKNLNGPAASAPPTVMTLDCPLVVTFRQGSRAAPAGTPADGRRRITCVIDGQQLGEFNWGGEGMMINMSLYINLLPRLVHANPGHQSVGGHYAMATKTIPLAVAGRQIWTWLHLKFAIRACKRQLSARVIWHPSEEHRRNSHIEASFIHSFISSFL